MTRKRNIPSYLLDIGLTWYEFPTLDTFFGYSFFIIADRLCCHHDRLRREQRETIERGLSVVTRLV